MSSCLVIRADASSEIGTGHIMRCMALAQVWIDAAGAVRFLCAEIPDPLRARIKSEGVDLVQIDAQKGSPEDLRQTLEAIRRLSSELCSPASDRWLVVDGYHFGVDYQHGLRAAGVKLLLIDDYNHHPEYEADILVNQNIGAEEIEYRCNPECRKLLGTRYVMLRREFRTLEPRERNFPTIGIHLLVTLGGADPDNVTRQVIEALNQVKGCELCVKIIVGAANPHIGSLQQAANLVTFDLQLLTDVKDMPSLMRWADLAISAAGSTCWELCCLGVPFLTLVLAENQRGLALELDSRAVASCLGENPSVKKMELAIERLAAAKTDRARRSAAGRELVDGLGAFRVLREPAADAGLELLAGKLSFRPAGTGDMELFWNWVNDPSVRVNCYNPEPVPLETHCSWFSGKLDSPDTLMLVLELRGVPVGQIRYDRSDDVATIGFSIDCRFRGLGLGRKIIEQSLGLAFDRLKVDVVRAEVFQSNPASQSAFLKSDFELVETCEIKGVPSLVFVKKRI